MGGAATASHGASAPVEKCKLHTCGVEQTHQVLLAPTAMRQGEGSGVGTIKVGKATPLACRRESSSPLISLISLNPPFLPSHHIKAFAS